MFDPFSGLKQATVSLIACIASALAIGFALAFIVQTVRINGFLWIEGLEQQLADARGQIERMERASQQTAEDQATVNRAPAQAAAAIAGKSDHEAPAYYAAARSTADAHAVRMPAQAARGAPGAADLPATDPALASLHGPTGPAELVCRPGLEDRQLVTATARAAEMHQQALDLIATGAAVAATPSAPEN